MQSIDTCDLCGSRQAETLFAGRDRLHNQPGEFHVMRCRQCGLIYLNPRPGPDEIGRYYPADYLAYPTAVEDESSWLRRADRAYAVHKRCREVIRRAGSSGRILDVGCATGIFLHGMQQRGWQAVGIEPSEHAASYARQRFGLDVFTGYLEDAELEPESFDVVSLWDVLEHVPDPADTLERAARLLKPGGWLILSLPNPDAWERHWFGKYWAGWDVPRHFHLFTERTLAQYLHNAGLKLNEVSTFTGRHGVLVLSAQFWMTDWRASERTKRLALNALKSIPARVLTYPYYSLADRLNRSSVMVAYGRKPAGKTLSEPNRP